MIYQKLIIKMHLLKFVLFVLFMVNFMQHLMHYYQGKDVLDV